MKSVIFRLISSLALLTLITAGAAGQAKGQAQEFTFLVEHDHAFKSCKGELVINAQGIEYSTTNKDHARKWAFIDIAMIKLASPKHIEVLTYESSRMKFGRDKTFEFKILNGEVSKEVSDFLLGRVSRPLATSFAKSEEKPAYAILVRHRHSFGGDQGVLNIYADGVAYDSVNPENSRRWRWTDIRSISRMGPYQFGITTYERKFGGPTKTFNFDLKERMDDAVYDYLWARVYEVTLPASPEVRQ